MQPLANFLPIAIGSSVSAPCLINKLLQKVRYRAQVRMRELKYIFHCTDRSSMALVQFKENLNLKRLEWHPWRNACVCVREVAEEFHSL